MTAKTVSARKSEVGDLVHQVSASDPEGNAVTYSMAQSPDLGFFDINIGRHSHQPFKDQPESFTFLSTFSFSFVCFLFFVFFLVVFFLRVNKILICGGRLLRKFVICCCC